MNRLKLTNLEKYHDPLLYDAQNDTYTKDLSLIEEYADICHGPIIDLACGTGRSAVYLAERGHHIIGVDIHQGMLDRARKKAESKNVKVDFHLQDATKLDLSVQSPFLFLVGNAFQHFLTNEEQDALLSGIHAHLEEEGIFLFGTRFLEIEDILGVKPYEASFTDHLGRKVTEVYEDIYHPLEQVLECVSQVIKIDGEKVQKEKETIRLRYVLPQEMKRLLEGHGFTILHAYSDWNKTPMHAKSKQLIYVCKKDSV